MWWNEIKNEEDALAYYSERKNTALEKYQQTGRRRYMDDADRDGMIASALQKVLDGEDAAGAAQEKRSRMIEEYIDSDLPERLYTRDEIVKMLRTVAWW